MCPLMGDKFRWNHGQLLFALSRRKAQGVFCFRRAILLTQRERMVSGALYDAGESGLVQARFRAKGLVRRYNQTTEEDLPLRRALLGELLGEMGEDVWIEPPFRCDYGTHISVGSHFYANYDCIILDVCPVTIGDHVLLGPRVGLYAASHPLDAAVRATGLEYGAPIAIGDHVWIGGNAVICPGVTVGAGSVIGAGSVVTRDIPPGVVAAGNPCRVLRAIGPADRERWKAARAAYEAEMGPLT